MYMVLFERQFIFTANQEFVAFKLRQCTTTWCENIGTILFLINGTSKVSKLSITHSYEI